MAWCPEELLERHNPVYRPRDVTRGGLLGNPAMCNEHTSPQHRFERSIVQEGYPNPSIAWTVGKIRRSSGPISVCIADWFDAEFETRERESIMVPHHELVGHIQSSSADEIEYLGAYEVSFKFPGRSRAKARRLVRKSEPRGVLIRAMYLALAYYRANPIGRFAPVYDMNCKSGTKSKAEPEALRVKVRREMEFWAIADGEITVRKLDELGASALAR